MNIYFMRFDGQGFITDLTKYGNALREYAPIDITDHEIPGNIMRGYYRWNDGFVKDEARASEIDPIFDAAEQPVE